MKSLFEYSNYKPYLRAVLGGSGQRSGKRSQFARAVGCHTAYISKVLNGNFDLSQEQAFAANTHLGHNGEEGDFFLLLVQKSRAGTSELKKYYRGKLEEIIEKRQYIKRRIEVNQEITSEVQNRYYSAWYYSAIHMVVSIPSFQTLQSISSYLRLPEELVREVLEFLMQNGLIFYENKRYQVGPVQIHLGKDSTNLQKHLTNWKTRSLQNIDGVHSKNDIQYAVTYSLSKKDALVLKERILKLIDENLKTIAPSPEEVLYCNIIDFFELGSE